MAETFPERPVMRDTAIHLRARAEQRDLIDQAAGLVGKTRSDFMLEAACDKAQNVLLDQTFFQLDAKRFARFEAMINAPPADNPALTRLLNTVSPWEAAAQKSQFVHEPVVTRYAARRKKST